MGRTIAKLLAGICAMSSMAAAADAARYIKVEFTGAYAPYIGLTFDGTDVREYQYFKSLSGEFLLDTTEYGPGDDAGFVDRTTPGAETHISYRADGISIFYLDGPARRQLVVGFSPVDLSAPSFTRTTSGRLRDTYLYHYRSDDTETVYADVGSVKITGFDSATTLTSYATWTARQTAASAAPEPASWALMLIGFGTVGSALRRRQRTRVSFV
jgi:hypothetical protein